MMSLLKRAPILAAAALSLILSAFVVLPAVAQQEISPEHLALARKYLDLTDKSALYETTVVQAGIDTYKELLPQNPEIANPLNDAITVVVGQYKGQKGQLFDQLARVYALSFTEDELKQIVDFYASPVGQKLAEQNLTLNTTVQRVMKIFRVNLRTEFFARVRAELKAKGIDS